MSAAKLGILQEIAPRKEVGGDLGHREVVETEIGDVVEEADRALGQEEEAIEMIGGEIAGGQEVTIETEIGTEIETIEIVVEIEAEMTRGREAITKIERIEETEMISEGKREETRGVEMREADRTHRALVTQRRMIEMTEVEEIDLAAEAETEMVEMIDHSPKIEAALAMTITERIASLKLFETTTMMAMTRKWMDLTVVLATTKKSISKWTIKPKR